MSRHPIPDHVALKACPFCGRAASVAAHWAAPDQPVTYSVGCWVEPDPYSHNPHWKDCLGPQSDWTPDLEKLVRLWKPRARGGT